MEHEDFITNRKEYKSIEEHGHDEGRGHVTLYFHVDTVLRVCDLIVVVQRPREHDHGSADSGDPKSCENMTYESLLEKNGMDAFEKEI